MEIPCLPVSSSLIVFWSLLVSRGDLARFAFGKDLPKWDDDLGPTACTLGAFGTIQVKDVGG